MDHLCDSIKSGVYPLSAFDGLVSYVNIRHVNFYANRAGSSAFMPADKLETAFFKTLSQFPLFVGDLIQRSNGRMDVVIDKDKLNIPNYLESQSDVHFRDIELAGYSQASWPVNLETVGTIVCPDSKSDRIKLADIHVVRLRDNSGIIISTSFAHAITDAYGCFEFLNHWADQTRALITNELPKDTTFCFDRSVISKHISSERASLSKAVVAMYTNSSYITNWIAWLSPNTRGKFMKYSSSKSPVEGCLFRIPRDRLEILRAQVLEFVPSGTRISDNDLLSALTYKVLTQANVEVNGDGSGWFTDAANRLMGINDSHCLGISCDVRHRLGISGMNFIGNPIHQIFVPTATSCANQQTSPQVLADIALKVREAVSLVTPPYIGSFNDLLESGNTHLGNFIAGMMSYKLSLWISNQTRTNIYKADFGNGTQSFATVYPEFGEGAIILLPSPPPCRDVLVNLTISPKIKENILQNDYWMRIAEFVY